ncbi:MAG TPA: YraN family protein [Miltoncostaeaceae bacterium]|nr:YraN family protein [Miltoncostaeaceae bacterium]
MDARATTGRLAEEAAERYLRRRGWDIVARNRRTPAGEVDIVARRRGVLAVIEVKARGDPRALTEPLTSRQRGRIVRAADSIVARRGDLADHAVRFDLMAVDTRRRPFRVRHLPGAFEAPPGYGSNRRSSG